ncbi:hypothetical protein Ptc2401_00656 [Prosthecochloris sp. CIB 2401]|nr:hypothetical protein Ptc2401_00656 [Prosthecochloris sp. CIB 2401]
MEFYLKRMRIVHKKNDFGKNGSLCQGFMDAWILLYSGQYDTFNYDSGAEQQYEC